MMTFRATVFCCLVVITAPRHCHADAGDLVATFPYSAKKFAVNPTRNEIYFTAGNSIVAMDANSLSVLDEEYIGSGPYGIAVSPDGTRVYTANSGSQVSAIGVYDTATRMTLTAISQPNQPYDIAVGNGHRIYTSAFDAGIHETDGLTGTYLRRLSSTRGGLLGITPDSSALVNQVLGYSPSYATVFSLPSGNVSYSMATGSNGQDLAVSSDGSFFAAPNGAPYSIPLFRMTDGAVLGTLGTGPYPREIAFSPDDAVAYAIHTAGEIDVFDISTYSALDTWNVAGEARELLVDASGRYLFAAFDTQLRVYDTGRFVPEPHGILVSVVGLLLLLKRKRAG